MAVIHQDGQAHLHLQPDTAAVWQQQAGHKRSRVAHKRCEVAQVHARVRLAVPASSVCHAQPGPGGCQAPLFQAQGSVCTP